MATERETIPEPQKTSGTPETTYTDDVAGETRMLFGTQPSETKREAVTDGHGRREHGRPASTLVRELFDEGTAFVRAEMALARTEMKENITSAERGVTSMAGGGVVLLAGVHALVAAAILALALVIPAWASALIVGGLVCLVGGIMVAAGRRKASVEGIKPDRTLRSLDDNRRFARDETNHAMEKWR